MGAATLIIGESGTGKSTSLRNIKPEETLLIQTVRKPLPFRSKAWKQWNKSPMGMFESHEIENDLEAVDAAICEYYGIEKTKEMEKAA